MRKLKIAMLLTKTTRERCFSKAAIARMKAIGPVSGLAIDKLDPAIIRKTLQCADAAITGWGTPMLSEELLAGAPKLRYVLHSAGSVKNTLCEAGWKRGIRVTTTSASLGISVAEFALGLLLVGLPRGFALAWRTRKGQWWECDAAQNKGMCQTTIGVVGAGFVGRHLIELLKQFPVTVLLYDPYVTKTEAVAMGVVKTDLNTLMRKSDAVTIHAPSIPETDKMINTRNLSLMKQGALLINTSRGSLVDEAALAKVLAAGKIFACLDVTDPEPPAVNSPFRKFENVFLTPHISGTGSALRQGDYVVADLEAFAAGKKPTYELKFEMLARMA